jgi:hypothetical protein
MFISKYLDEELTLRNSIEHVIIEEGSASIHLCKQDFSEYGIR